MIKKLFITLLFCLCLFPLTTQAQDWDVLNEPCDDFTTVITWTDIDGKDGVSEIDPAGYFHFYCPSAEAGEYAGRTGDVGSYPDTITLEIKLNFTTLGTQADVDRLQCGFWWDDGRFYVDFCSDGLFIQRGAGNTPTEVGTDIVDVGTDMVFRFLIDYTDTANGEVDVYKDNSLVAADFACGKEQTLTDGYIDFRQYGYTVNTEVHIDYIKIDTGLTAPAVAAVFQPIVNIF